MFFAHRTTVSVIFSTLTTLAAPIATAASTHPCDAPRFLAADDQIRQVRGDVAETHCYRLDLASPGMLALDATVAGSLPSGATLSLREAMAPRGKSQPLQTIGRNAGERLVLAAAGSYFLEVRAEDPRQPLPAYRLTSRFLGLDGSETDGEIEIEPEFSETDGEIEIEPEFSETDGEIEIEPEFLVGRRVLRADGSETDGEIEIEPEFSETDGEIEIEPEFTLAGPARDAERLDALLSRLCRAADTDDHADFLACATPIEHRATAELDNGWGDDIDTFRFEVTTWQTIEITTEGIDTLGTLYDRHGQRLAAASDDRRDPGDADGFRIVRTLAPGRYFVKVEGVEPGSYDLRITTLAR